MSNKNDVKEEENKDETTKSLLRLSGQQVIPGGDKAAFLWVAPSIKTTLPTDLKVVEPI